MSDKIEIDFKRCKGCSLCVDACPPRLISMGTELNHMGYAVARFSDPTGVCNACKHCAISCPDIAITVFRANNITATGGA